MNRRLLLMSILVIAALLVSCVAPTPTVEPAPAEKEAPPEQASRHKTIRVNVNINGETYYRDVEFATPCKEGEWSEASIDVTSSLARGPGCRVFLVIRKSDCGEEEWGMIDTAELMGDCFELPPPYTLEPVKNTGWQDSPIGNDRECFLQGTEGFCRELQE